MDKFWERNRSSFPSPSRSATQREVTGARWAVAEEQRRSAVLAQSKIGAPIGIQIRQGHSALFAPGHDARVFVRPEVSATRSPQEQSPPSVIASIIRMHTEVVLRKEHVLSPVAI